MVTRFVGGPANGKTLETPDERFLHVIEVCPPWLPLRPDKIPPFVTSFRAERFLYIISLEPGPDGVHEANLL